MMMMMMMMKQAEEEGEEREEEGEEREEEGELEEKDAGLQRKKHFLKQAEDSIFRLDEQIVRETELLSKDVDSLQRSRAAVEDALLRMRSTIDGLAEKNVGSNLEGRIFRMCDAEETLLLNGVQNALDFCSKPDALVNLAGHERMVMQKRLQSVLTETCAAEAELLFYEKLSQSSRDGSTNISGRFKRENVEDVLNKDLPRLCQRIAERNVHALLHESEDEMQEKRRKNLSAIQAQILHELEHMNRRVCTASDSIETGSSSALYEHVSREIENFANVVAMFKKDTAIFECMERMRMRAEKQKEEACPSATTVIQREGLCSTPPAIEEGGEPTNAAYSEQVATLSKLLRMLFCADVSDETDFAESIIHSEENPVNAHEKHSRLAVDALQEKWKQLQESYMSQK